MARKIINTGSYANDGAGDDLRTGATKINDNFQELYSAVDNISLAATGVAAANGIGYGYYGVMFDGTTLDSFGTVTRLVPEDPTQINTITLRDSSGEVAFVDDIGRIINRNYILNIKNSGYELKDENEILQLIYANSIDSARAVSITIDSAELLAAVDSAYVQARQVFGTPGEFQPYIDSAVNILRVDHDSDIAANRYDIDFLLSNQAALNTGDVTEDPSNLYYTKTRTDSDISQAFGSISQDLIPSLDSTYDLGSPTNKWKDLHLSGNTIFLGNTTITNDGSNISFGTPINAEIVVSNSMDLGSNVIQSSTNDLRLRPGGGRDVRLETIDGLPIFTATTNGHIYIGDSNNGVIIGTEGWFHLGNNSQSNRNSISVGDLHHGLIHYNSDTNKVDVYANSQWDVLMTETLVNSAIQATVDSDYVQARQVSSSYLHYGYDAALVGTQTNVAMRTVDGASPWLGYHLPLGGKATHISWVATASSHSGGSQTFTVQLWKNGVATGYFATAEFTGAGSFSTSLGIDVSFEASDGLELKISQDNGMTTQNIAALLRIEETL